MCATLFTCIHTLWQGPALHAAVRMQTASLLVAHVYDCLGIQIHVSALQHADNMVSDICAAQQSSEEALPAAPVEIRAAGKRQRSVANTHFASKKRANVGVPSTGSAVVKPGSPDLSTQQSEPKR